MSRTVSLGLLLFAISIDLRSVLALLRTVTQVLHPSIASRYITVWCRKYLVTGAIGPYGLYKRSALGRCAALRALVSLAYIAHPDLGY